ncbi:MAG TPA: GNAT family N-acetyltransferase [Mycobacteriales bacterium]|nr:GNAT family N-acetyltransferase [Mycobacteriales bacterium]
MDALTCRPAGPGDLAAVRRLACGFDRVPATPADAAFAARFARLVASEDRALPLAVCGGEPVGYALVQDYGPGLRREFGVARLHDLYVDPAWRRRGAGRLLLDAVVAWCRARPHPLILDWQARRDAAAFYAALGHTGDEAGDTATFPAYSIDLRQPSS